MYKLYNNTCKISLTRSTGAITVLAMAAAAAPARKSFEKRNTSCFTAEIMVQL